MTSTTSAEFRYEDKYKNISWYRHNVGEIDPAVAQLFEQRGISSSDLVQHVERIHHKAFEIHPWPCVGGYLFLKTMINKQVVFPSILPRLQRGDTTILDLGCALGQDVRVLISDGVPSRDIYALDYFTDFWNVGFELFNDNIGTGRGMEEVNFLCHNFLLQDIPKQWEGNMDFIFAGAFFHIFDYQDQVILSKNAAKLLRTQPGSMIFGYRLGRRTAAERPLPIGSSKSGNAFWHNQDSFDNMWQDIGSELGIQFKTSMTLHTENVEGFRKIDPGLTGTRFVVEVLSMSSHKS